MDKQVIHIFLFFSLLWSEIRNMLNKSGVSLSTKPINSLYPDEIKIMPYISPIFEVDFFYVGFKQ